MMRRLGSSLALRMALAAALAVMAPPAVLHAQELAYAASMTDLDSATQALVRKEIALARAHDLPVEPLIAKVREGRLKRAPGARIRAAVERLSERMGTARDALGAASTPEEITAGADALAAGAQASSLRALRAATAQPLTAPVGALAQLLASGVTEAKAMEMVLSLLRRNAAPEVLVALGNQVEADVSTGLSATASAAFRLRAIETQLSASLTADAPLGGLNSVPTPPKGGTSSSPPQRKP